MFSNSNTPNKNRDNSFYSSPNRIAHSVALALKPLKTSSPPSLYSTSADPSNFEANTQITYDGKSNVFIEIESDDISSLRASINSYLRLADASYKCIQSSQD
ncbi:MAG: KEOPS complex subunit Pcc1 [Nitrososphaeraceae archaeon]